MRGDNVTVIIIGTNRTKPTGTEGVKNYYDRFGIYFTTERKVQPRLLRRRTRKTDAVLDQRYRSRQKPCMELRVAADQDDVAVDSGTPRGDVRGSGAIVALVISENDRAVRGKVRPSHGNPLIATDDHRRKSYQWSLDRLDTGGAANHSIA